MQKRTQSGGADRTLNHFSDGAVVAFLRDLPERVNSCGSHFLVRILQARGHRGDDAGIPFLRDLPERAHRHCAEGVADRFSWQVLPAHTGGDLPGVSIGGRQECGSHAHGLLR
mgnify:CR=1 FL=1